MEIVFLNGWQNKSQRSMMDVNQKQLYNWYTCKSHCQSSNQLCTQTSKRKTKYPENVLSFYTDHNQSIGHVYVDMH
jgi:hypothetical protein